MRMISYIVPLCPSTYSRPKKIPMGILMEFGAALFFFHFLQIYRRIFFFPILSTVKTLCLSIDVNDDRYQIGAKVYYQKNPLPTM